MHTIRTNVLVLFLVPVMALGLAACSSPFSVIGGPSAPCAVTNSPEAANALLQRIASQSSASGSAVTVTANNQEVTSLMNQYLEQAKQQEGDQAIPLQDAVICFKTGSMTVFGKINGWGINSNALITVTPVISGGQTNFQIQQIQLGPISAPPDMSTGISTLISNSFNRQFSRLNVAEISLQENQMRVSGTVR
jgi:hypothetical protein